MLNSQVYKLVLRNEKHILIENHFVLKVYLKRFTKNKLSLFFEKLPFIKESTQ